MFKPRLIRLDWLHTSYPIYFVTACTHARQPFLSQKAVHETMVSYFVRGTERGIAVGRYVLLPDHVHLFAACSPHAPRLSEWVKGLKRAVSSTLSENGIEAPYWQKGFFDHVLRTAESYGQKWAYVRENPVRAGLVSRAEDWPYQGEIFPLQF